MKCNPPSLLWTSLILSREDRISSPDVDGIIVRSDPDACCWISLWKDSMISTSCVSSRYQFQMYVRKVGELPSRSGGKAVRASCPIYWIAKSSSSLFNKNHWQEGPLCIGTRLGPCRYSISNQITVEWEHNRLRTVFFYLRVDSALMHRSRPVFCNLSEVSRL